MVTTYTSLTVFSFLFWGPGGERGPLFAEVCASATPSLLLLLVLLFIIMEEVHARLCEVRACDKIREAERERERDYSECGFREVKQSRDWRKEPGTDPLTQSAKRTVRAPEKIVLT